MYINYRLFRLFQQPQNVIREYELLFNKVASKPFITLQIGWYRKRWKASDVNKMMYKDFFKLTRHLGNGDIETAFKMYYGINKYLLMLVKVTDFYPAMKYLKETIKLIRETEKEFLSGDSNFLYKEAEEGRLAKFGDMMPCFQIFNRYLGAYRVEEIECWTYSRVFTELYWMAEEASVQKKFNELQNKTRKVL